MEEIKYYCYICDEELTDTNNSDEHIILNAIGGHLHSNKLLCKRCNKMMKVVKLQFITLEKK